MKLEIAVLLVFQLGALAVEESCDGRCNLGFELQKKCQCDSMCKYYQSCCTDYDTACTTKVTRGDVFHVSEDDYDYNDTDASSEIAPSLSLKPFSFNNSSKQPDLEMTPSFSFPQTTTTVKPKEYFPVLPDTQEITCNGKPFDAFTQMKNGSIYAFRGEYFYELDKKAVKPGYPKMIKDVWGIEGPIDAAFTRINCQGKTYIFKDKEYWRFDDGVLDPRYPRKISSGFSGIPDNVDAAFALPASNYYSKEKVYFFKGDYYYEYAFRNQPSQKECAEKEPSALFSYYASLHFNGWDDIFSSLFHVHTSSISPRLISRDWIGIPGPVDAVMAGRLYVTPKSQTSSSRRRSKGRRRQSYKKRKMRKQRSLIDSFLYDDFIDEDLDFSWMSPFQNQNQDRQSRNRNDKRSWKQQQKQQQQQQRQQQREHDYDGYDYLDFLDLLYSDQDWPSRMVDVCQPIQNVFFFIKDQYYRVNLLTKMVDMVSPAYPRPISKYWLGCREIEEAEKK
ncbi:vitronectin a [Polypterus senegalus]|uniref:vitronectin a n=1 Tax=Polypterus senegalus TaxID=55291 RepID=UPI0019660E5E|nr:vitronectin a [Polypterus senegalus]